MQFLPLLLYKWGVPPSHLLSDCFSLSLTFWSLNMIVGRGFILLSVLWASWICTLMSDINRGKFSVIIASNISSVPFYLLLWYFHYTHHTFVVVPQFLDSPSCSVLGIFSSVFFLFIFQFWKFLASYPQAQSSFLSMSSLLMSPSKASFMFVTVALISSISFSFSLRISIFLFTSSGFTCCLLFPLKLLTY